MAIVLKYNNLINFRSHTKNINDINNADKKKIIETANKILKINKNIYKNSIYYRRERFKK